MGDIPFSIAGFKVEIPAPGDLLQENLFDMNGLRFYGGAAWKETAGTYTFGSSDSPTYVLIGLVGPTFTPMLLAYGEVTLETVNAGIDFYNYVKWTQGLYTLANQLATGDPANPTAPAQATGGMTIQPNVGGFYTDSLINAGTAFAIENIAGGMVTTTQPSAFTSGQKLQFSDLVNPSGGVENGAGYIVGDVHTLLEFTIKKLDGTDLPEASAGGGTVASVARSDFAIESFAHGTVTTTQANSFASGEKLQLSNLVNPSGGVENGTGYIVGEVQTEARFTIKAPDGSDLPEASADGGTVASMASSSDSETWGALVPNGQQMQLTTPDQMSSRSVYFGFTPERILYTKTTDAVPEPVLQFSGVQSFEYKGGTFTAGLGFQSANQAQYLQIDYRGYYQFVDAHDGDNELVLTVTVGCTPKADLVMTNGISDGFLTIVDPKQKAALSDDDYVHLVSLDLKPAAGGNAPPPLTIGTSYQVTNLEDSKFQLKNPETEEIASAGVNASAAALIPEKRIAKIDQQNVTIDGQTVPRPVVTMLQPHGLLPGDAIVFKQLHLTQGVIFEDRTYYVTDIVDDESFLFAENRGADYNPVTPPESGEDGRVTLPLGQMFGFDIGGNVTVKASIDGGYQAGDWVGPTEFTIGISGSVSMSYLRERGTSVAGSLSLKGNNETSEGLVLKWKKDGGFNVAAGAFSISGSLSVRDSSTNEEKIGISLSGISGAFSTSDDGTMTCAFNGSVSITIPGWNWSGTANFGHGQVNGLTLIVDAQNNRFVQELAVSIVADHIKPPSTEGGDGLRAKFAQKLSVMGFNGSVDYNRDPSHTSDWSLLVGGAITLAIGDSTPDAQGNWKADDIDAITFSATPGGGTQGGIEISPHGARFLPGRYELDVNGPFKVKGELTVVAQSLKGVYQSADPVTQTDEKFLLSGGVAFPDFCNARIQLGYDGASGGLEVDVTKGTWKLDGWRFSISRIAAGPLLEVQNVVVGFGLTMDAHGNYDYKIQAGGQVQILQGKAGGCNVGVYLNFDFDKYHLKVTDIGASLRRMNPGILMPPVDGALTDIAFDVAGIPGSISADILFGAVFGSKVTVGAKEYAMIQAIVNGQYKYKDIDVTGTILLAGGTLGEVTGTVDLNWGTGEYTVDFRGKVFYDVIDANARLFFSSDLDYGLFSARLQVPPNIPIVGGMSVLESDAMYYADHRCKRTDEDKRPCNFMAAWFTFLGHWKYGVEIDLVGKGVWTLIGTSTVKGLEALLPAGTGSKTNKYNIAYAPTTPSLETRQLRGLEEGESSDSYGLMNVVWYNPDGANDTLFIASGNNNAVQVYGPGTTLDRYGWVNDSSGGVSYTVVTDQSTPGNVLIHVAPTASFTAPGASHDAPDLYIPLPDASLNVVLTSNNPQSGDPTTNWTGSFAAAAPQLQNLTVTQPKTASALGDDESRDTDPDPVTADNATISFQWRGLDPDSTAVSLYYDYDSSGYSGTYIATVSGSDLTDPNPDGNGFRTVTVPWDIGDLEPARPLYVYAAIKDNRHAAVKSDYAGQVQTVPAAQIQVSYAGGTSVSTTELQNILLRVTPVKRVNVNSIAAGVVTVTGSTDINPGDLFMFSGLTSPVGVENTMPYYVLEVDDETFTFSNVAAGAPISEAAAGQGTAYVDQDESTLYGTNSSGVVWPHVNVNQRYRFSMAPPRGVFVAAPSSGQEVSNVGELVQYNTFVGNNQLLRMSYQFKVLAAIAGRVYSDLSDNGQLDSMDTGLAGATVYLDDNNNNVLDPGEDWVVTGPDGNFLFVHQWAATDPPTATYTTWVKVIPPAGCKVTSSPNVPSTGITFTNNGDEQAALNYYNFMIASPVTVSGTVYEDANRDGVRGPGDKALQGVTVNVTPPSGSTIVATTNETGRWQATTYERGTYSVSVGLPPNGTLTTPTSMSFTADAVTALALYGVVNPSYGQTGIASQWNPATRSYSVWLAALHPAPQSIDFVNIGSNPTGDANNRVNVDYSSSSLPLAKVSSRFDAFIGKWSGDGTPSLAVTYITVAQGSGARSTELAVAPSSGSKTPGTASAGGGLDALYALSYDPNQPNYSTVASIDNSGQVTLWKFDPTQLGKSSAFSAASETFKLTRGTPLKMVGFNKAGRDHFQSQDLAVVYSNANGVLALAELDHATNTMTTYAIGGRVFVDMIAGDFDDNGHEDVAVITADTNSQRYYLNVLLSQDDGSTDLVPYVGDNLAIASDGTPSTTLASIRVMGGQQALLWNTQSASGLTKYITAALVTGGQIRVASGANSLTGRIAAISAGDVGKAATFAIYALDMSQAYRVPVTTGGVQVNADGKITFTGDLTKYGGSFSGFDIGVSGVSPAPSNITSGIVYNDTNSNGIQDSGETGLPGVTVRLIEPNNETQTAVTSDGSDGRPVGSYSFENVPSGAYIQVMLPPGTWTAENPPPGVSTNSNGAHGIVVGVTFAGGEPVETIGFPDGSDNAYSVAMKSADLQGSGQDNLVIRTSSALFVQRFQSDGTSVFDRYDVSSPAAYFRPQLYLEDLNADGRIDVITSGQSGVDVFINIDLGEFRPFTGLLAEKLTNSPNGTYAPGRGFTGDVDSGVTKAKTYTHALNFGGSDITVNGVTFQAAKPTGEDYALAAADPRNGATGDLILLSDNAVLLQGNFKSIAQTSYLSPVSVNGTEQLTLSGLTPGLTYTTTFYTVGNDAAPHRIQTVVDSVGGTLTFDANGGGNLDGYMISRTFVAPDDSMVFTFFAQNPNDSFNLIALTNETVPGGYSTPVPFTGDADSGIANDGYYTHALHFAATDPVTVNGLTFTPAEQAGPDWLLTAFVPDSGATEAMGRNTGFNSSVTGSMNALMSDFFSTWLGGEQLILAGLTIGATYTTTWYSVGYQEGVQRVTSIADSLGGYTVIDQNEFGSGNGIKFSRTFVATSERIIFTFIAPEWGHEFHQFALTNRLVSAGDYKSGGLTGDSDSGISLSKMYTHALNFAGTAPLAINGVNFTPAGESGSNWELVAYDSGTNTQSPMQTSSQFDNNLKGSLNSAASDFYYSESPTGQEQLTLSGLTPGVTYTTTFYSAGRYGVGSGKQIVTDSLGGDFTFDQDASGAGNGSRLTRTYVATSDSVTFTFTPVTKNSFNQFALTNEVVPPSHQSPDVYGTELAVVPSTGDTPAKIYAAQQNTQTVYELAWDIATATLGPTGRFFPIDRFVTRLLAGSVVNEGELNLVVYENANDAGPVTAPGMASYQKLWVYTAGDLYTTGAKLIDFGFATYHAQVDLLLAALFSGVQTVVFMGTHKDFSATDIVTYRAGSGANTTSLSGVGGLSLGAGQFVPGSRTPNILVAGINSITVLDSGTDPKDVNNPDGPDPNVPLVVLGRTYTPNSWNAAAVGASATTYSDDLMAVRYDENAGFIVLPYFNITGGYEISGNAGGGLYDFPVVVPGSNGGTINGNVFYDANGNGKWEPTDHGVYDDITVYLDLNNNGQWDPGEPRTFPDSDGDYQFAQLPPQAYTVGIQIAKGYILTTPPSVGVTIPAVPGAEVNGVDFGVKTKNFGADFNNDHQPDLLLSDPKDQSVYVQLRNGLDRLGTYKIGTLPSADWLVAGVHDVTGNGAADVLIHNVKTGELRVWEFFPDPGTPTVARTIKLEYVVPTGYTLLGMADLDANGQPELILGNRSNGDYRALELRGLNTSSDRKLEVPAGTSIVGACDIDLDGNADLLLRESKTDHLLIHLFNQGKPKKLVDLGKPKGDWSVAGITGLLRGDRQEILFQEKATGKAFAWTLDANLSIAKAIDLDIGIHDGLRLHLAER